MKTKNPIKVLFKYSLKNVVDRHMLCIFCCYKNMNKNTQQICTFVQESCSTILTSDNNNNPYDKNRMASNNR